MHVLLAQEVSFPTSAFVPLAVGFFGLGTGYLIYGPQELRFFASLFARPAGSLEPIGNPAAVADPDPDLAPGRASVRGRRDPGALGERALGFLHLGTGIWLMYLTWATVLNIANGFHLPL